jgi:hypothetical protein
MTRHGEAHNAETEKSDFGHVYNLGVFAGSISMAGLFDGDGAMGRFDA